MLNTRAPRRPWSKTEDAIIIKLVKKHGRSWSKIANDLEAQSSSGHVRTGKQCRERWHNHLNPDVNKDPWSVRTCWFILLCQSNYVSVYLFICILFLLVLVVVVVFGYLFLSLVPYGHLLLRCFSYNCHVLSPLFWHLFRLPTIRPFCTHQPSLYLYLFFNVPFPFRECLNPTTAPLLPIPLFPLYLPLRIETA